MNRRLQFINAAVGLSLVGLALATYSLLHKTGFTSGAVCDINSTFNCDVVNRGPYSDIGPVPVALLGVIGYVFFALTAFLKRREPHDRNLSLFLVGSTGLGFLFSLYLSGLEAFVLHAYCVICLSSQLTVALLFGFSTAIALGEWKESRGKQALDIVEDALHDLKEIT